MSVGKNRDADFGDPPFSVPAAAIVVSSTAAYAASSLRAASRKRPPPLARRGLHFLELQMFRVVDEVPHGRRWFYLSRESIAETAIAAVGTNQAGPHNPGV